MGIEVYIILLVFGASSFIFWKWVFTKRIANLKKRKIAIWASTIVGTPLVYVLFFAAIFAAMNYYPDRDFDSIKWKQDKDMRYELTADLIESELLIDKSPKEVEQLLGKAETVESNIWLYDVGFVPTIGNIDPDIIEITFKNNKVLTVIQRNT